MPVEQSGPDSAVDPDGLVTAVHLHSTREHHVHLPASIHVQIAPEQKAAIELVNMAVSNTAGGVVEFHTGGTSGDYAGSSINAAFQHDPAADKRLQTVKVAATTLDEYLPSRLPILATTISSHHHTGVHAMHAALDNAAADAKELYIVKIDTQGFDGVVIEGMKELLRHKQVRN